MTESAGAKGALGGLLMTLTVHAALLATSGRHPQTLTQFHSELLSAELESRTRDLWGAVNATATANDALRARLRDTEARLVLLERAGRPPEAPPADDEGIRRDTSDTSATSRHLLLSDTAATSPTGEVVLILPHDGVVSFGEDTSSVAFWGDGRRGLQTNANLSVGGRLRVATSSRGTIDVASTLEELLDPPAPELLNRGCTSSSDSVVCVVTEPTDLGIKGNCSAGSSSCTIRAAIRDECGTLPCFVRLSLGVT